MLCPSDYRVRLVPRNAGWFPRLGQGALPRSRKSTSTLWVLPVLCSVCGVRCAVCVVQRSARVVARPVVSARHERGRGAAPCIADVPASSRPGVAGCAALVATGAETGAATGAAIGAAMGTATGVATSGCNAACNVQTALAVCRTLMA